MGEARPTDPIEDISTRVLLTAPRRTTEFGGHESSPRAGVLSQSSPGSTPGGKPAAAPGSEKSSPRKPGVPRSEAARSSDLEDSTGYSGPIPLDSGSDTHDDLLGTILDRRYRIVRLIGEGGMGRVYEAEHVGLGRKVAVKVLHPMYSNDQEVVERFRREARAASAIGHPNIVDVTDTGTTKDGRAFFVMEFLDGVELADVIIDQGTLDPYRAAHIAVQVCRALVSAHKAGIIHRDLKPENIFLVDQEGQADFAKVLDFGIAKSTHLEMTRGGGLTQPGFAMGTPEYMAPEQAAGMAADGRVDIYAVGGILYAMLVGRPPHQGRNVMETLNKKATEPAKPLHEYRKDVPEDLERIVMWCLERRADDRPSTMEQLEYELRKFLSGRPAAVAALLGLDPGPRLGAGRDSLGDSASLQAYEPPPWEKPTEIIDEEAPWEPDTEILDPSESKESLPPDQPPEAGKADEELPLSRKPTALLPEDEVSDQGPESSGEQGDFLVSSAEVSLAPLPDEPDAWSEGRTSHTVVTVPPSSHRWVVALLVFLSVAGIVTGWLLWRMRHDESGEQPSEPAAALVSGPVDAAVPVSDAMARPKAADVPPDASVPRDAAMPRLTRKQYRRIVSRSWRAARKGRWTKPAYDNLLEYLRVLDAARPKSRDAARLRRFARKKLLRRATIALRRKKLTRAEAALRDLLAITPKDRDVTKTLASLLLRRARKLIKSDPKTASALAGEAVVMKDRAASARLVWAEALAAAGQLEQGLVEYRRLSGSRALSRRQRRRVRREIHRIEKVLAQKAKEQEPSSEGRGDARPRAGGTKPTQERTRPAQRPKSRMRPTS